MSFVNFAKIVGKLKRLKRTGWVVAGVKNPESVAEHSFRLAVFAMVLGKKRSLDTEKLIKMALIHDLGESMVGDLIQERGRKTVMHRGEKYILEEQPLKSIFEEIGDTGEYLAIWKEFEENKSPEAQLIRQLDKLEMVVQALEYEREVNDPKKLGEFWINAKRHLKDAELLLVLDELSKLRKM